jgi:beta-fructofuranosidase
VHIGPMELTPNQEIVLDAVRGNTIEIEAEIAPSDAPVIELTVLRSPAKEEYTRIAFFRDRGYRDRSRDGGHRYSLITLDAAYGSILPDVRPRAPETAPVYLAPDEPLKLRVFVDRSVVEVFVNGKQCVGVRVYPGREDSVGVSLRSQGQASTLRSVDAWQMENIYQGG